MSSSNNPSGGAGGTSDSSNTRAAGGTYASTGSAGVGSTSASFDGTGGGGGGVGAAGGAGGAGGNGGSHQPGGAGGLSGGPGIAGGGGGTGLGSGSDNYGAGGGGGGGGGTALTTSASTVQGTTLAGGAGGAGGSSVDGGGGGGGAGGFGVLVINTSNLTVSSGVTVQGGAGGAGGASETAGFNTSGEDGGNGGDGGIGVSGGGLITNAGTIQGGTGGAGGNAPAASRPGTVGLGADGIVGANLTVINTGLIRGGAGSRYGAGLFGSNLTVTNAGIIAGGFDNSGISYVDAIDFTGGSNTLTLSSGGNVGTLNGNIAVSGALDVKSGTAAGTAASLGGGALVFASAGTAVTLERDVVLNDKVTGFGAGDTLDFEGAAYSTRLQTVFTVSSTGGTLRIVDPMQSNSVVTPLTLKGSYVGGLFTLASDSTGGTALGFVAAPPLVLRAGDVETSTFAITGQSYTGTVYITDASGQLVAARYTGVTGQAYQSFETDYSDGANTQTQFFYSGITGQPYTTETLTVNAAGQQTAAAFGGFSSGPYSSYEYDYASGLFAGSKFTVTAVPAGATYSSYEIDYNYSNTYLGAKFFYTSVAGQSYTGEEVDTSTAGVTNKVLLTGFTGQPYQTLELDYTGGAYTGYKTFASNITGQSYTGLETDVTAAGQLTKVVYNGLKNTTYNMLEQDYTSGALSSSTFTFDAPAGQTYSSYAVTENAAGTQTSETVNNTDGSHTIVGSAPNLIFESIGNDRITGGGSGETFDFSNVFGQDTITDFSGNTTGAGHDTIALSTADFTSFAALSASAQNVSGGVVFTGKSGSQITLLGLDKTTLAGLGTDFTFHA